MKRFVLWFKKWWWVFILAIGAVVGFLLGFRIRGDNDDVEAPPNFVEKAKVKKETIEAQAAVEKIKIKSKANAKCAQLDEIDKIEDVRERRKRLAIFLQEL